MNEKTETKVEEMKIKKILDMLERIELQSKVNWWDNTIFFICLVFILLIVPLTIVKSPKVVSVVVGFYIFLFIFSQLAEKKELNKVRREYEKARKEISA